MARMFSRVLTPSAPFLRRSGRLRGRRLFDGLGEHIQSAGAAHRWRTEDGRASKSASRRARSPIGATPATRACRRCSTSPARSISRTRKRNSRARPHRRAGRLGGVRLSRRRRVPHHGRADRSFQAGDARAQGRLRRLREALLAGQGGSDAEPSRERRDALRRRDRRGARADASSGRLGIARRPTRSVDANDWRLCVPSEPGPARDLFLEAPSGWWLSAKAAPRSGGRDCFSIALHDKPADGALPVSARATITGGSGALDVTLSLGPKS